MKKKSSEEQDNDNCILYIMWSSRKLNYTIPYFASRDSHNRAQ